MYKCLECGHIFEDGEEAVWYETHGFSTPPYERWSGCPMCKGDFEETVSCLVCGGEFLEEDLIGGVCKHCVDDKRNDFDACYKISVGETATITINALIATLLEECDIEQILIDYIKSRLKQVDCSEFINSDPDWFGERLAEEVRRNEKSKIKQR